METAIGRALHAVVLAAAVLWLNACIGASSPLTHAATSDVAATPAAAVAPANVRKNGERVTVTIYEFRSTLANVSARAATDMFKTALVQSGQFRVVERSRLNEGVAREKQLQQAGLANGKAGQTTLRGARYVFEGTVSEAASGELQRSGAVSVAGAQVSAGSSRDSLAIDVRIVDANSGEIVDAVAVRRVIENDEHGVSGIGNLLSTLNAQRGKYSPAVPDVQWQQRRTASVDAALRSAIEEAVARLAKRLEV